MKRFLSLVLVLLAMNVAEAQLMLRQSDTAEIPIGPFISTSDGFTPLTSLTITNTDVRVKKCTPAGDCGAWGAMSEATNASHEENGNYEKDVNTTDTDTVGPLHICVFESGALPWCKEYLVVEEAIFDACCIGGVTGQVTLADGSLTSGKFGSGAINSAALDTTAADEIADDILDEDMTGHQTQGSMGQVMGDSAADTDSIWSLANTNLNATIGSRATDAGVWTNGTRTLTAGTNIVLAKGTGVTGFNDILAADVWAVGTRVLTAGTNIVLAKGTGVTGFNDIAAGDVWNVDATGFQTQGTFGQAIGDPGADSTSIWATVNLFVFTATNNLNVDVQYMNGAELFGNGTSGNKWDGTP